ncbi:MAG: nitroreductase family deazaflavin-dependent oxidoreductase [Pseudomonadota bacterium]
MSTDATRTDQGAPPPRWVLKLFTRINVLVYKLSGGRLMNTLSGMPICLVEMTGARSGKQKTIPLMYVPHEKGILLVASQGGSPKHPVWYHNLQANPAVRITQGGTTQALTVRQVDAAEKAELWPTCVHHYPPYQDYQDRTDRDIPVFVAE